MIVRPTTPLQQAHTGNLRIFQINLNKSEKAHLKLINNRLSSKYEIILIQEPHCIKKFNNIRTPPNFRPVYPSHRTQSQDTICSAIWVNRSIDTSKWTNTNDITTIQMKSTLGTISIFNIYNDCAHSLKEHSLHTTSITTDTTS